MKAEKDGLFGPFRISMAQNGKKSAKLRPVGQLFCYFWKPMSHFYVLNPENGSLVSDTHVTLIKKCSLCNRKPKEFILDFRNTLKIRSKFGEEVLNKKDLEEFHKEKGEMAAQSFSKKPTYYPSIFDLRSSR